MNNNFPFIDLSAQKDLIEENIKIAIDRVLEHGKYILGPEVDQRRKPLRNASVKNVVTCANGTDALSLALMAWNIGPDDAIFLPSFSYISTAEAPAQLGAVPFFVDVKKDTYNMCPDNLQSCIKKAKSKSLKPSVVVPVDLFGQPAEIIEIEKNIKRAWKMKTLVDSAQSFGASIGGKKVGSFGDATTTSFFPSKPLGCYGDGGAIFTNDDKLAEKLKSLRFHGIDFENQKHSKIGLNSRLDSLQAAILIEKLKFLTTNLKVEIKLQKLIQKN